MLHALVVSVLMFFGQVHFCEPEYILPSGATCYTCPSLTDLEPEGRPAVTTADHGDCHDCCTIKACDDTSKGKAQAVSAGLSIEVAPAPDLPEFQIQATPAIFAPIPFVEGNPPTGPPPARTSRGPPVNQHR